MKKIEISKIYHILCKPAIDNNNQIDTIQRKKKPTQNSLKL